MLINYEWQLYEPAPCPVSLSTIQILGSSSKLLCQQHRNSIWLKSYYPFIKLIELKISILVMSNLLLGLSVN